MSFRIPHPARFAVLAILAALILTKIVWVQCCCRDIGTFESEKEDILACGRLSPRNSYISAKESACKCPNFPGIS